ncbi:MAG: ERCC4 domain-containing protein, partial [Alphaproteobacteria bacterium]
MAESQDPRVGGRPTWVLRESADGKFPYRLSIEQGRERLLALRVRDRWPGPGMQVFCLRDEEPAGEDAAEPIERVPVASLKRLGRKLSVVLDRPTRKRCDFLFLERAYKSGEGRYEQIFWRTEQALRAHRSGARPQLRDGREPLEIAIDSAERYPWSFEGSQAVRRRLAVGDYALLVEDRVAAVVERKSFENMLAEIVTLGVLHQKLGELESHPNAVLVVEAQYGDFLDPSRLVRAGKWTPAYLARVLGEIAAVHPKLQVVYAGNRKLANTWAQAFFASVAARLRDPAPLLVAEAVAGFGQRPSGAGLDERIRLVVLHELPESFTVEEVRRQVSEAGTERVRRVRSTMREEGRVRC